MKIAIFHELVYPYNKGGGEIQRFQIARYLAEFGHDVTLIGYRYPNATRNENIRGFKIKRVGPFAISDAHQHFPRVFDALSMMPTVVRSDYDIMMTNPYFSLPVTLPFAKLFGKTVVVTWDDVFGYQTFKTHKGSALGMFGDILEKMCLFITKYADHVFTVSTSTKEKLIKSGIKPEKITVMYSGVNLEDYPKSKVKKKGQIVYVGRHVFYKNVDHLIRAFANIAKSNKSVKLVILGYGTETETYKQLAKELNIDSRIEFRGFVNQQQKIQAIRESLFLVLPSSFEGFGLVLAEANICDTPYIAYDIPAVREVTEITKGGILVENGNIVALESAMKKLLSDSRLRQKLANVGQENVSKHLTWKSVAKIVNEKLISLF